MPRKARVDISNNWYHVTARGQRKEKIFYDSQDYIKYLTLLMEIALRYNAFIGAFCLMPNHIHLIIYINEVSLGVIFRQLHTQYAKYFNDKYKKTGYVFQGRFFSRIILNDKYMAALLYYLHYENPVGAGLVDSPEKYRWSSDNFYRFGKKSKYIKITKVPGFDGTDYQKNYIDIFREKNLSYSSIPKGAQYIGEKDIFENMNKRKIGRSWNRIERREKPSIKNRIKYLLKENNIDLQTLQSRIRVKRIADLRNNIIIKLYEEGYLPSEIGKIFKRSVACIVCTYKRNKYKK